MWAPADRGYEPARITQEGSELASTKVPACHRDTTTENENAPPFH
jgi:hypothetical protein